MTTNTLESTTTAAQKAIHYDFMIVILKARGWEEKDGFVTAPGEKLYNNWIDVITHILYQY